jgi:hypothetical protein
MYTVLFALAILSLILIPFAPTLVRLRIRILRWLHWNWAVNLLEKHFDGWVGVVLSDSPTGGRGSVVLFRLGRSSRMSQASDEAQKNDASNSGRLTRLGR